MRKKPKPKPESIAEWGKRVAPVIARRIDEIRQALGAEPPFRRYPTVADANAGTNEIR